MIKLFTLLVFLCASFCLTTISYAQEDSEENEIMNVVSTNPMDIVIETTATSANKKIRINKYFANAYTVDWWDGTEIEIVSADKTHTYTWAWIYEIILSLTWWADRWTFQSTVNGLITYAQTSNIKIIYMPSLAEWFGESATSPGDYFFCNFNYHWWKITSLPEWSFDTSKITTAGNRFFYMFNEQWQLTNLPEGSFRLSTWLTSVWDSFFWRFNAEWQLTSLPEWSFDTSQITTVGNCFFCNFNFKWRLTSLPKYSFDTSNISWTVGNNFFARFNREWGLGTLPENSFNISNITTVWDYFFEQFNNNWSLRELPENSFNTSKITTVGDSFFKYFNYNWWKITSLPDWSFDTSKITTAGSMLFYSFNQNWAITRLPDSFKISSAWVLNYWYENAFRSYYTLNKKVSDLVAWISVPNSDRNTFSDNQPWRCGVYENWLVTTADACHIIYNANWWIGTTTWWYASNITGVEAWLNISAPTRVGYLFGWWDATPEWWTKVEIVTFPDMDGQTLYAHWNLCEDGYTADYTSTTCIIKDYNLEHNLKWWYIEDSDGNKHEWNLIINYIYDWNENIYKPTLAWNVKRENSKFLWWYTSNGEKIDIFNATGMGNDVVYAKYECNLWYIENEEWTICEKIRVEFDANGWSFWNETLKIIESNVENDFTRYSHTLNIDNEWNQNWNYDETSNSSEVITITWATRLHIKINYWIDVVYYYGSNYKNDYLKIRKWNYPDWDYALIEELWWYKYDYTSSETPLLTKEYDVDGDTVTFNFNSSFYSYEKGPGYGYYAVIKWDTAIVAYPGDAFDNISQPTRNGYKFAWWYLSDGTEFNTWNVSTWTVTKVYAKWEKNWSSWWWGWGWWGGGWSSKPDTPKQDEQGEAPKNDTSTWTTVKEPEITTGNNAEIQTWSQVNPQEVEQTSEETPQNDSNTQDYQKTEQASDKSASEWYNNWKDNGSSNSFTKEQKDAYEFARQNWITTTQNIQQAQMNWKLTRIQMAKMLSQYAINVLWKEPDISKWVVDFSDVTRKMNKDYDDGVTLAYQLWIMWQNMPNNKFRPNDEVSRAEFVTALSRLLYSTLDGKYESTPQYYVNHMEKLKWEWIITKADPKMKELRGYVMIMLMRSVK